MQDIVDDAIDGSISAAQVLEAEIERRGLHDAYVNALLRVVIPEAARWDITNNPTPGGYITRAAIFALMRATPEQRARAFLAALHNAA